MKTLIRLTNFFAIAIFAIVAISCGNNKSDKTVKIGAVLPLTGKASQYGVYFKQGSELALSDAIEEGLIKDGQVQMLFEDGKGDAATSLSAFNKLKSVNNITSCLVDLSNVILAIKPIANKNSIVCINSSSFSSEIEDADDSFFSVLPNAKIYGGFIGGFCFDTLKYRRVGILYRNDPMGKSFEENFSNKFISLGGAIAFSESHAVGETDYKPIIQKYKSQKLDAIFVASYGPEIAGFAKQCKELNFQVQIITYQGFFIKSAIEAAGTTANGIICIASAFNPSSNDANIIRLRKKLKEKYNTDDLNYYLAAHYDGTMILLEAISKGNTTGSEIRNYLNKTKTFKGLTGEITFDENGLASIPLKSYKVVDNIFVPF